MAKDTPSIDMLIQEKSEEILRNANMREPLAVLSSAKDMVANNPQSYDIPLMSRLSWNYGSKDRQKLAAQSTPPVIGY